VNAYLTCTGAFLPGPPIDNAGIESVLGLVQGKPSRLKARILKSNGIQTRHYAIDATHRTTHSNVDMAVAAAKRCLDDSPVPVKSIGMLSCATTQGDMVVPGFGSMVQAELGVPAVELLTTHGICSSSVMAVKAAANSLRLGDHASALVVVSELASRLLKSTRYEAAGGLAAMDFNSEFLRWMLSDGAGAWLLESAPRGRCLRIDWIRTFSHADAFPVCMGIGTPTDTADARTWQDYPPRLDQRLQPRSVDRDPDRQDDRRPGPGGARLQQASALSGRPVESCPEISDARLFHRVSARQIRGAAARLVPLSGAYRRGEPAAFSA
jgi:3-oxoacyl-[acyl-carrier-protein] synthase-3